MITREAHSNDNDVTADASGMGKARVGVQRFGTFLSGMIMPNIAAFIAWGIITAFFIAVGWTPDADLDDDRTARSATTCSSAR